MSMYTHVPPLLYDMYSRGQKINVAGNQESKQSLCGGKEPQKSMGFNGHVCSSSP